MPLTRHILVTISESLYTVYIRSNDEVINGTGWGAKPQPPKFPE